MKLDKFFGIMKRAWYLFFGVLTVVGLLGLVGNISRYPDFKGEHIAMALMLPVGWVGHKIAHWIIWGKFK
jgi:hypothetical protein